MIAAVAFLVLVGAGVVTWAVTALLWRLRSQRRQVERLAARVETLEEQQATLLIESQAPRRRR